MIAGRVIVRIETTAAVFFSLMSKEMNSIFRILEQILKDSEDYISHEAGLFCHGLIADLPQKILIVTSSRRRDRVC